MNISFDMINQKANAMFYNNRILFHKTRLPHHNSFTQHHFIPQYLKLTQNRGIFSSSLYKNANINQFSTSCAVRIPIHKNFSPFTY